MYMKKYICIVILALTVLSAGYAAVGGVSTGISLNEAIEQSAEKIAAKIPAKSRVVIVAFDSPNEGLSHYIMEELTGSLINNKIEVADRQNLDYLYKELNFQTLGDASDESAQAIGKYLGAQLVISGALIDVGEAYRFRISAIQVETATFLSIPRFDVRNDNAMKNMVRTLARQKAEARTAKYGVSEQSVPQTAGNFFDRGIMFAMRKNYGQAVVEFTQAIRINPNLTAAYILRGRALLADGGLAEGVDEIFGRIKTAGSALSKDPEALQKRNRANNQAAADYSEAIRLEPDNAVAYNGRGVAWHQLAGYDRALEDFNQAMRLSPDYAAPYFRRGDTYYSLNDFNQAIEDYNRAIQIDPKNKYTYIKRAWVYRFQGDYDPPIADYTVAIQIDPNFIKAYMERGGTYREKEEDLELTSVSYKPNYNPAIADFTRVIRIDPNYANAYCERALTYQSKKDYDRAIADLARAIQIESNNKYFYRYRGDAYMGKKDYNRAIADYEAALRIDSSDVNVQRSIQRAMQEREGKAVKRQ
jgi:tetratricopeptide (TPR) repeat protein